MRGNRIVRVLKIALLVVVGVAVFSLVVMSLWNWLTPALFGWHRISFWQALGLLVLSKILFGGFRGRPGMHWRRRVMERWEQMTPRRAGEVPPGTRSPLGRVPATGSAAEVLGKT